jgi:hypothetical protein
MSSDAPKTSEEMIEEARRGFDEQAPPDVDKPRSGLNEATPSVAAVDTREVAAEPLVVEPAPTYPSDGIETPNKPIPAPLPPELEDLEEPEPGFVTRLWARRGIAVALIIGGVFVYSTFFDDSKPVESLSPGECINDPGVGTVIDVTPISCDEAHDFEVFATVTLPADGDYPSDSTLLPMAWDECNNHFEGYVGVPFADSVLYIHAMVPTEDGWADGDRGATCLLFEVDAAERLVKSSESVRQLGV